MDQIVRSVGADIKVVKVLVQGPPGAQGEAGGAPLDSPSFTGNPTSPTPPPGDNDTSIATTAFVQAELATVEADLVGLQTALAGKQPLDSDLTAFSGKTAPSGTVVGTTDTQTLTGKTINASSNTLTNITTTMFAPNVVDTDPALAANSNSRLSAQSAIKSYVDNFAAGLHYTTAVRVATTANGALATAFANGQTVDGVTLATGDRILIKSQTAQTDNGIYTVNASGAPTRGTDADTGAELKGIACLVTAGTANAGSQWQCSNATAPTIGTTSITWVQIASGATAYSAGAGLSLTGNQFAISDPELLALLGLASAANTVPYFTGSGAADITAFTAFGRSIAGSADAAAARAALLLGTAATQTIGSAGATVPLLSTANTWTLAQSFTVSPTSVTPTAGDSSTKLATTAFVVGALGSPGSTSVSAYQWRMALAQQGKLDDAYAGLGDIDTTPRIQWDSCRFITPGDALATNVQATLAYTSGDMTTLFNLARTF